jgi:allophanate hydrolase subunit 2
MTIEITEMGLALIQDAGRNGYADIGVGFSGALHQMNYRLANDLIGSPNSPCIEILQGNLELKTDATILLSVVGNSRVFVNKIETSANSCIQLAAKQTLKVISSSFPSYVAILGLDVAKVLGSASTDTQSGLGPDPIRVGCRYEVVSGSNNSLGSFLRGLPKASSIIEYFSGPYEIDVAGRWTIERFSRSGFRLSSKKQLPTLTSLPSFPVMPGAIQVTPTGLVILGRDCGTTGGYPVAGVVTEKSLDDLCVFQVGSEISLSLVDADSAKSDHVDLVADPKQLGAW